MAYTPTKFGDTSGLRLGDKVLITIEDVTAGATYVSKCQITKNTYIVELDGTGAEVKVPGWTISKPDDWKAHREEGTT